MFHSNYFENFKVFLKSLKAQDFFSLVQTIWAAALFVKWLVYLYFGFWQVLSGPEYNYKRINSKSWTKWHKQNCACCCFIFIIIIALRRSYADWKTFDFIQSVYINWCNWLKFSYLLLINIRRDILKQFKQL